MRATTIVAGGAVLSTRAHSNPAYLDLQYNSIFGDRKAGSRSRWMPWIVGKIRIGDWGSV
jgi:hypothetical protein